MSAISGQVPRPYYQLGGLNTYVNPISQDGILIHAVNVVSSPLGAKSKRPGYSTFLNAPDAGTVNTLFQFDNINNSGTQMNLYRASGSALYYSLQGTGNWTLAGNGTITNNTHFGQAVLGTVLIGGEGVGSTRHTTDGTSFVNTTLAPVSDSFTQFQNRIYANGTANSEVYSTANDATNWLTSGTSDSNFIPIPGGGKLIKNFKIPDTLIMAKNSGEMFKWDGFNLIDMSTHYGPSSPYSVAKTENSNFFVNQFGHYIFSDANPQLLSNAIQRQFYNIANTGIAGTALSTIPAGCHIYDYLASVGTITDDFTTQPISNAIIKYDYQKNEYLNWSFANKPTAFLSYKDTTGKQQLLFGDSAGQCYQLDPTKTSDNGQPINLEMVFFHTYGIPGFDKKWNYLRMFLNPGCQARVQVACTNVFDYQRLEWQEVGDVSQGVKEYRFPAGSRSQLLFIRFYDASPDSQFSLYGYELQAQVQSVE